MGKLTTEKKQVIGNIWLVIRGILVAASFCIFHKLKTSSIVSVALFALYIMLYQKNNVALEKREKIVKVILGGLFSFFIALGEMLVIIESQFASHWVITFGICFLGQFFLMELILGGLLVVLRKNYVIRNLKEQPTEKGCLKVFGICLLLLVVVWGIGWVRTYPGSMSRDSIQIANMAMENIKLDAAVPIVYILPIRLLWNIGQSVFGPPNAGLALCTFVQMFLFACVVAYSVTRLYANRVRTWICVLVPAYFALMPYNSYMLTTIWKDVPFSACMLWFMVMLFDQYLGRKAENKVQEYGRMFLIALAGMGVCLMRNNGLYAFILFLPFGIWLFWKKNRKLMITLVLTFVLVRVVQGPVYDSIMTNQAKVVAQKNNAGKENTEKKETKKKDNQKVEGATNTYNTSGIYIITAQQLANVAVDRPDLSQEDYERLDKVINVEQIRINYAEKSDYCRRCIDMTMPLVRFKVSHKEYLKTWAYFGMKYPINYVLGWRGQTIGYWYPDIQNWTTIDAIIENEIGVYKEPLLSQETTNKLYELEELYKKVPAYSMLWSIGFVVWITLFYTGIAYIRKGIRAAVLYLPLIGVWLTLLVATPIYAEFRYVYALFICLPFVMLFPYMEKKEEAVNEK